MPQVALPPGFLVTQRITSLGRNCANPPRQRQKWTLKFNNMKSLFFSFVFILLAAGFTACNKDFETPAGSEPSANTSAVQLKLSATASPYLKDGDDDNEPDPMFCISGTVTQNGSPVTAEVQLTATPGDSLVDSTTTDSNGGFKFDQVTKGNYNVVVIVGGNVASVSTVNL